MTKIVSVQIREISTPLSASFSGGTYQVNHRAAILCQVKLEDGQVTTVSLGNETGYTDVLKAYIAGPFRALAVGSDIRDSARLWAGMLRGFKAYIPREDFVQALAVVDTALWIARAEHLNVPLWQLLGGARERVPVIGIGGYYETARDAKGIEREYNLFKRMGLAGVKFKVGALSIEEDAHRVLTLREIAGHDYKIVVDSNMAWSTADAVRFATLIKEVRPEWLEEPIHPRNITHGLRDVRLKSGIPIGAGQSDQSVFESFRLLTSESIDVLNMTYNRGGGITAWSKLAAAADLADLKVAQVGEPHISMHLMGGASNGTFAEIYPEEGRDPFWHQLYPGRPQISEGHFQLPTRAGLGFDVDLDAAENFAVEDWR
ncbi:mandelate racemase/muconate lactonizing enzyme family protein [Devosia albogilva]|jgi:L-alanine-DL-glutamate epimerase-like enolase superfamily enzyme|uniref:Mandelate racemase/muconate lactonizing enzyme family protein n=1 Tax=Devosia albogilva TaxID=429726 RepID=A0ABW5QKK0_9HYPH